MSRRLPNERIIWDHPLVKTYGRGKVRTVDYDMWRTDEKMSEEAFERLGSFMHDYRWANYPRMKGCTSGIGVAAGQIQVLPEHAEEVAVRVLLHISDPKNFDQETRARVLEQMQRCPPFAWRRDGTDLDSHEKRVREAIVAKYPDFVGDPLGQVPRCEGFSEGHGDFMRTLLATTRACGYQWGFGRSGSDKEKRELAPTTRSD